MLDSSGNVAAQITTLLDVLRQLGDGRYACLADAQRVHFESGEGETGGLRRYLESRAAALFGLPGRLGDEAALGEDVFADWDGADGFLLAFINRRVAAIVACPAPEELQEPALPPLKALAERVFQWRPSARGDGGPLSLFFNRPRLDLVVVSPPETD
jgi:hypothetical protein